MVPTYRSNKQTGGTGSFVQQGATQAYAPAGSVYPAACTNNSNVSLTIAGVSW